MIFFLEGCESEFKIVILQNRMNNKFILNNKCSKF